MTLEFRRIPEAAKLIGLLIANLSAVIEGPVPVSSDVALRLEAAGWPNADLRIRLKSVYDLAQAHRQIESNGSDTEPSAVQWSPSRSRVDYPRLPESAGNTCCKRCATGSDTRSSLLGGNQRCRQPVIV